MGWRWADWGRRQELVPWGGFGWKVSKHKRSLPLWGRHRAEPALPGHRHQRCGGGGGQAWGTRAEGMTGHRLEGRTSHGV